MKHTLAKQLLVACAATAIFSSCSKDNNEAPKETLPVNTPGVYYISNEGSFNAGNGNITFYDFSNPDFPRIEIDYFRNVNNRGLGDVVQSVSFNKGKGFIVVNGSGKVEVVDSASFTSLHTISSIASPRYFKAVSETKAYITDWASNAIHVVDLANYAVTGTIPTSAGPEQVLLMGQKAYVGNTGGFSNDSVVSVINTVTDAVESSVLVGVKPSVLLADRNNDIWVMCTGQFGYFDQVNNVQIPHRAGELVRINGATNQVSLRLPMPSAENHPTVMAMSPARDFMYYVLGDKVYRMGINETTLPQAPFITETGKLFYGISVNPENGEILVTDAPGSATGRLYIYTSAGAKKGSVSSGGHFPNSIVAR